MPCIFCIAVFAVITTAITTTVLDHLEAQLAAEAATPLRRVVDSSSVRKLEFEFPVPRIAGNPRTRGAAISAPVALTAYKQHGRVRIQVLTHDLQRAQSEALQRRIAAVVGLEIVAWSDPHTEQKVRAAIEAESRAETQDSSVLKQPSPPRDGRV